MKDESSAYATFKRLKHRLFVLKLEMILFGLFVMFVGLYPYLDEAGMLPAALQFLPMEGVGYRIIVIALGALALFFGFRASGR